MQSGWVNQEWTDTLTQNKLIPLLHRDCDIPPLLRALDYIDLRTNHPDGFLKLRTFLLTRRPLPPTRINHLPTRPPLFVGRQAELAELRQRLGKPGSLVPICELPGRGKTTVTLEFAHEHQTDFTAVYWVPCQSGLTSAAAELTRLLGLKLEGDLPKITQQLRDLCANKRCLLILDNVDDDALVDLVPGGAASVLVTTQLRNLPFRSLTHYGSFSGFPRTNDTCWRLNCALRSET